MFSIYIDFLIPVHEILEYDRMIEGWLLMH